MGIELGSFLVTPIRGPPNHRLVGTECDSWVHRTEKCLRSHTELLNLTFCKAHSAWTIGLSLTPLNMKEDLVLHVF